MSDHGLLELRRRVAQGEPGARAALLTERLRLGELTRERLDLAAYVGDPDARATGFALTVPTDPAEWFAEFSRWGKEVRVRAGLAACQRIAVPSRLAVGRSGKPLGDPDTALAALAAVRRWLACPCVEHSVDCYWAADAAGIDFPEACRLDPPWGAFAQAACVLGYEAADDDPRKGAGVFPVAAAVVLAEDLRSHVSAALASWALSQTGPV